MSLNHNESAKAKKWRFQIHLSTAIVLMFVAGALVWANFTAHRSDILLPGSTFLKPGTYTAKDLEVWYGFPRQAYVLIPAFGNPNGERIYSGVTAGKYIDIPPAKANSAVDYVGCAADLVFASFILFLTSLLCEWLISRLAVRKED